MNKENKSRFDGIDILKCISAFLIICIHKSFPGEIGQYIVAIARFCVPIFLMISGFFYNSLTEKKNTKSYIKRMSWLLVSSNILYFILNLAINFFKGKVKEYICSCFSVRSILKFVFFNVSPFGYHLWYLGAIIYVIVIIELLKKITSKWKVVLYIVTPFLIIGDLILGKYSILLWGRELVPYVVVRNFLFVGIPYFSIGLFLNEYKKTLSKLNRYWLLNLMLIILFSITSIFERNLLINIGANATRDQYISTTFLSIALFILFSNLEWNKIRISVIRKIGKDYTLLIYIIHPIIIIIMNKIAIKFHGYMIYKYLAPIFVFFISVVISMIYKYTKLKILLYRNKIDGNVYVNNK